MKNDFRNALMSKRTKHIQAVICKKGFLKILSQSAILCYKFHRQSTTHAAHLRVSLITVQMRSVCW